MNFKDTRSYLKGIAQHYQPRRLSLLLTAVALALWALSLIQAKLVLDDWGIIHSLPPSYFIALGLLTIASFILWRSSENHDKLLCFQLCLLISMLWLTPLLLGTTLVSTRIEIGYFSGTEYIISFGHIDPVSQWSHNWPSIAILGTALVEVLGIQDANTMLIWAPFVIQLIMVLPLYLFFRNTIGRSNYCWAAVWIFYLFNHTALFYFGHQALALFLLWVLMALLLKVYARAEPKAPAKLFIILLLLVGIILTHLLTALACLFIIASLWVIKRYNLGTLVMLFAIMIALWTIYVTTGYFNAYTPIVMNQFFRLDLLWEWNIGRAVATGSEAHLWVANIRVLFTILACAIGLAGLGLSRKFRSGADGAILAIAAGILLMLPFAFYGGELFSRAYLYLLPVLAYFGVRLFRTKASALILLVLLVVALPFSIISLHGNQAMDHISPSQRAYWHFIEDKTTEGRFTGGGMAISWNLDYLGDQVYDPGIHIQVQVPREGWRDDLFSGRWPPSGETAYLALSSFEEALYKVGYGDSQFIPEIRSWLNSSSDYNLFYTSGDVSSYMYKGGE